MEKINIINTNIALLFKYLQSSTQRSNINSRLLFTTVKMEKLIGTKTMDLSTVYENRIDNILGVTVPKWNITKEVVKT